MILNLVFFLSILKFIFNSFNIILILNILDIISVFKTRSKIFFGSWIIVVPPDLIGFNWSKMNLMIFCKYYAYSYKIDHIKKNI